jgi:hypothetical protein
MSCPVFLGIGSMATLAMKIEKAGAMRQLFSGQPRTATILALCHKKPKNQPIFCLNAL